MSISDRAFSSDEHISVLKQEVLDALQIQPDGMYVDGTFGRGGHAQVILEQLSDNGKLIVMDRDPAAIAVAQQKLGDDARVEIFHQSFSQLGASLEQQGLQGKIDGILLDLGVSSPQLDGAERGFSFQQEGPLDMRMNPQAGQSAAEWLNHAPQEEIAQVLWEFGEERQSRKIARKIVQTRDETLLATTTQLAKLVERVIPNSHKSQKRQQKKHPATRTFQAIRIFINRELEELQQVLMQAVESLAIGGRLAVISFHSLEDRIVKRFFRDQSKIQDDFPTDLPIRSEIRSGVLKIIGKPIFPSEAEIQCNPRARSSVLRIAERQVAGTVLS